MPAGIPTSAVPRLFSSEVLTALAAGGAGGDVTSTASRTGPRNDWGHFLRTLTEQAASMIWDLLVQADLPDSAGLRIAQRDAHTALAMTLQSGPS